MRLNISSTLYAGGPPRRPVPPTRPGKGSTNYPELKGLRVAVVEDEGLTQMQVRLILQRSGMILVGSATNGKDGIALVLREKPDIVLMDIKMPGAIDGIQAAQSILTQLRTCIIFFTAYQEHQVEALAIGASGYIVKPVSGQSLLPELSASYERFKNQPPPA